MTTAQELDTWVIAQPATYNGGTLDTNRMHTLNDSFVDHFPSKAQIKIKNKHRFYRRFFSWNYLHLMSSSFK